MLETFLTAYYLLSQCKSMYFSPISVFSTAPNQHPDSKCFDELNKHKTSAEKNPRSRKELKHHTDKFFAQCFHLSSSSSRDYLGLNNSCNRELTTTQSIYFQEVLNIGKLLLVWDSGNLVLLQFYIGVHCSPL